MFVHYAKNGTLVLGTIRNSTCVILLLSFKTTFISFQTCYHRCLSQSGDQRDQTFGQASSAPALLHQLRSVPFTVIPLDNLFSFNRGMRV